MYNYKFSVDRELKITSWDKNLENITGKISFEVLGNHYFNIHPRIIKQNADAVELVIKEGKSMELKDYQMNCLCGVAKADVMIDPVRGQNSIITGAEVTMKVNPVCLLSKKLNESKMLIDIGKASAGLAHGVRSPLNAIKGAIIYLKGEYSKDPTFLEFSKIIEDEISKLDKFITKFLSSSLYQPDVIEVDVNALLDKIVKMVNMQAFLKKISFIRDNGDIPNIKADYLQIENAILNVITNSIESIQNDGYVNIKTLTASHDAKKYVTIEISDSGHGFENMDISHALREETVREGRGFGLFITHEIVKNLGGYLEITSAKMVGTIVKINIPIE